MKYYRQTTQELVDRFLSWPLPQSVCSDGCVTNPNYPHPRCGTNLLTADEARQMIEYLLADSSDEPGLSTEDTKRILGAECAYQMPAPPVSVAHARAMIDSGAAKRIDSESEIVSDTPRTECLECGSPDGTHNYTCTHNVARLQRELAAAQAQEKHTRVILKTMERDLRARLAAAQAALTQVQLDKAEYDALKAKLAKAEERVAELEKANDNYIHDVEVKCVALQMKLERF